MPNQDFLLRVYQKHDVNENPRKTQTEKDRWATKSLSLHASTGPTETVLRVCQKNFYIFPVKTHLTPRGITGMTRTVVMDGRDVSAFVFGF